jgi:predicted Co/Zn/Cd cation transporter (cation efflux family)
MITNYAFWGLLIGAIGLTLTTIFSGIQVYLGVLRLRATRQLDKDNSEDLEKLGQTILAAIKSSNRSVKRKLEKMDDI